MILPDMVDTLIAAAMSGVGVIAGLGYGLVKLKVLRFGKKIEVSYGAQCSLHTEFSRIVTQLEKTQLLNVQRHEQSEHSLEVGEKKFDTLQEKVGELKEGIGILMDRTGGRPADWRGKKR